MPSTRQLHSIMCHGSGVAFKSTGPLNWVAEKSCCENESQDSNTTRCTKGLICFRSSDSHYLTPLSGKEVSAVSIQCLSSRRLAASGEPRQERIIHDNVYTHRESQLRCQVDIALFSLWSWTSGESSNVAHNEDIRSCLVNLQSSIKILQGFHNQPQTMLQRDSL
jgi:hypothetical protein